MNTQEAIEVLTEDTMEETPTGIQRQGEQAMTDLIVGKDTSVPEKATQTDEPITLALAMDATSREEFIMVDNTKYSEEIITAARAAYNPDKLTVLKQGTNLEEFLTESKRQILAQWHADQALAVHSDMYRVIFQINVGVILNEVEPTFKKKSEYICNGSDRTLI